MHLMQEGCPVQVILLCLVIVKELIIHVLFFEILTFCTLVDHMQGYC